MYTLLFKKMCVLSVKKFVAKKKQENDEKHQKNSVKINENIENNQQNKN